MKDTIRFTATAAMLSLLGTPAFAHVGASSTNAFGAGVMHPLGGFDHIAVMIAVGLWAALKGARAIWIWPVVFVAMMLIGAALGMTGVRIPLVEPGILASVVALGLLVALAVDLPVWLGALIIGAFAVFHGHAHGIEVPQGASGIEYVAGFAIATAFLHLVGIGFALGMARLRWQPAIRMAGAVCALVGVGLAADLL